MSVEKEGFLSERYVLPTSRFATFSTQLDIKLKEGTDAREFKIAEDVLNQFFLAQKFTLNKEFDRALVEVDKILAKAPTFARALSMRGSIYFVQKKYSESLKWYEAALQNDPKMEDTVKMIARIKALDPAAARSVGTGVKP